MASTTRRGMSDVSALLPRLASRFDKPTTPVWWQGVTAPMDMSTSLVTPRPQKAENGPPSLRHNGKVRRVGVVGPHRLP